MTDAQTWNELADEITELRLENARLRALQEKEPCDYCEYSAPIKYCERGQISVEDNEIIADLSRDYMKAEIKYCPMCGRKL